MRNEEADKKAVEAAAKNVPPRQLAEKEESRQNRINDFNNDDGKRRSADENMGTKCQQRRSSLQNNRSWKRRRQLKRADGERERTKEGKREGVRAR